VVVAGDPRWRSCLEELDAARYVGLDTEFFGPWSSAQDIDYWKAHVRLIQLGLPSGLVMVLDLGSASEDRDRRRVFFQEELARIKKVCEDRRVPKVGQSLITEYMVLRIHYGIKMRCTRDIQLMSQLAWAGVASKPSRTLEGGSQVRQEPLKHNMRAICQRLGIEVDKSEQDSDWSGLLNNHQLNYSARDVRHPIAVWRLLGSYLKDGGVLKSMMAECDAQPGFGECEYNGLPVDEPRHRMVLSSWDRVRWEVVRPFQERFPGVSPSEPISVGEALQEALDDRRCGRCGYTVDPTRVAGRLKEEGVQDGTPIKDYPSWWTCPGCFGTRDGFIRMHKREYVSAGSNKHGKAYKKSKTNADVLAEVAHVRYVQALIQWKSMTTCMDWLKGVLAKVRGGRIRGDYNQIAGGVDTAGEDKAGRGMGRSSCGKPNLQNPAAQASARGEKLGAPPIRDGVRPHDLDLPRRLRDLAADATLDRRDRARLLEEADAVEQGLAGQERSFFVADLSQAHARIAAQASRDPVMMRDFNAGADFHIAMARELAVQQDLRDEDGSVLSLARAQLIYGDKKHPIWKPLKKLRNTAKPVNYGSINLQGPETLKNTAETSAEPVYFTIEEATQARDTWRNLYSGLYRFQRQKIKDANRRRLGFEHIGVSGEYGEVRALTGRRLFLAKEWDKYDRFGVKGTDCVSAIWMQTEADIVKHAMGVTLHLFDRHPEWEAKLCNMAHDEIDGECLKRYERQVARSVKLVMRLAMRWGGVVDLPVEEAGAHWTGLLKEGWAAK
jgi:DNA polymerase I-like protein with 3'-5' exonuclease and polymerase domains/rubredoxin